MSRPRNSRYRLRGFFAYKYNEKHSDLSPDYDKNDRESYSQGV